MLDSDVETYDIEYIESVVEECLGGNWQSCTEAEEIIQEIYEGTSQYCENTFYECLYENDIDTLNLSNDDKEKSLLVYPRIEKGR